MRFTEKDRDFFSQPAETLAPLLLGMVLCRKTESGEIIRVKICDVEAYGAGDSANYGCTPDGKIKQARSTCTAPLFEQGGTCCIYGGMLLIVCGGKDEPDNVLIRGCADHEHWYSGPLKVANALNIDKKCGLHGADLLTSNVLWIEKEGTISDHCRTERHGLGRDIKEMDRKKRCRFITI